MPKYRLTGPDGGTYDVVAPEGASEADVMQMLGRQMMSGQSSTPPIPEPISGPAVWERPPGTGEGMARAVAQGGTFGAGDEIAAAIGAAGNTMRAGDGEFGKRYDHYVAGERRKLDQFRDSDPVLAYGSEIAGAIPTAALGFMNAPRAVSTPGRVAGSVATGGGQGSVYGFNAGDGDINERVDSALWSALIGGAVGGAAVPVSAGAKRLAERLMTGRAAKTLGMEGPAYTVMNRAMQGDDSLTGAGAQRLTAAGDDAMLADAGPNARALLDTAIQRSGPAGRAARDAVDDRVTTASGRLQASLDEALGRPGESQSRALVVYGDRTNPLDLIYKRAYAKPLDYASETGRHIEGLVKGRVPGAAIQRANELMRLEGHQSRQILANIADDGTVTFERLPDVRQLDYITRALNDVADAADGQGKLGGTTQLGRAYSNLSRELRNSVKELVPEYAQATKAAADAIRSKNAREFGEAVLSARTSRADVTEALADMGDAERRKVMEGLRQQIDDDLAKVKRTMTDPNMDAREAFKTIKDLSSRANRDKLAAVLGPEASDRLFNEVDRAAVAFELRAGVADNSKTFARTALNEAVEDTTSGGPINALREGRVLEAPKRVAQSIMGRTPEQKQGIADAVYDDLVRALTGPRGAEALQYLRLLQNVAPRVEAGTQNTGRLAETLMRRNAAVTAPAYQGARR